MARYEILVLDYNGGTLSTIVDFISLSILDTANDVGKWDIKGRTPYRQPFEPNSYAVFYRDGVYIYGGPMDKITETYDPITKIWSWQVSGYGFNAILKNLLIYPSGFNSYFEFTDREFSVTHTSAYSVIEQLINDNASLTDHLNSHTPGYLFCAGAKNIAQSGEFVDLTCRFENLLETCKNLATVGNLFILPVYDKATGKVTFVIADAVYPNININFSVETGGVISYTHTYTEPQCTVTVLSYNDDDEYLWQKVYEGFVYPNRINGRETFIKPSKEQVELVTPASLSNLADQAAKEKYVNPDRMDITVNPDGYLYGYDFDFENDVFTTDYRIGSIVTVSLPDEVVTARVMQMKIEVAYGKETMTPVFGDVTRGKFNTIFSNLRDLNSSVSKSDNTRVS